MKENMKHWDALKTTDPKYTKLVTFGRKFTSINSQWQLQRMTEQFGPIGKGWGYTVQHSTERLHDWYVLAVADVTIWWRDSADDKVATYGPVRGTSPVIEPARDKGKLLYEGDSKTVKMHLDDDAGKKAMTDALTKGLSHLGLSADVFLGLYDDHKYVQNVREQFADKPEQIMHGLGPVAAQQAEDEQRPVGRGRGNWVDEARRDGIVDETRQKGQMPGKNGNGKKTAAEKARDWTDKAIQTLNLGDHTVESLGAFWKENADKIEWMEENASTQHERFLTAYDNALEAAKAKVAA